DTSKYWTVTFKSEDETKGTVDAKNTVYVLKTANKTLADITAPKVTAKAGFKFTGWEPTLDANTTINKDMTVNAKFEKVTPTPTDPAVVGPVDPTDPNGGKPADTSKYWTVTFKSEDETKGTVAAKNTVYVLKTENKTLADITASKVTAKAGYEFDKWEPALTNATSINKDMEVKAYFKASGTTPTPQDPPVVGPVDPTDPNGGKPADTSKYWTVTFKADPTKGIMGTKNTFYVLKNSGKTLADLAKDAPKVTAKPGFKFTGWEPALDKNTSINGNLTVNAKFEKVTPTPTDPPVDPKDPPVDPKDPPVVGPEDPTQPGGKPQVANNKTLPKTASSMNIELYTIFMILSGALLALAFKRKKESQ
ncbi:InlB B-repeat-containing protein, partial [uncultured Parvimonas sp.]|uniref:InlB B-repeat-containing protein n=1 Tax=uncultured Parvimonas sp. TaxID=747372 RepID=UPI002804AFBA